MNATVTLSHRIRGGILLTVDTRFFLLYAFMQLLELRRGINYLRALIRVSNVMNDAQLIAIHQYHGIPQEAVTQVFKRMKDLDGGRWKETFDRDWDLVHRI